MISDGEISYCCKTNKQTKIPVDLPNSNHYDRYMYMYMCFKNQHLVTAYFIRRGKVLKSNLMPIKMFMSLLIYSFNQMLMNVSHLEDILQHVNGESVTRFARQPDAQFL